MSRWPALRRLLASAGPSGSLRLHWLQSAGAGVILNGISMLLALGSGVLAARLLGPVGLGQYAFVLAIVGVAAVPAALGLPTAVIRYVAIYQGEGRRDLVRGLLRRANQLAGLAGLGLGVVLVMIGVYAWQGDQFYLYLAAAPLIAILTWTNLRQKTLQGLHHPIAAQLPERVFKHSTFLLLGGALWLAGAEIISTPAGLMSLWLLASCTAFGAGIVLLRRFAADKLGDSRPHYATREWLHTAMPMIVVDSVGVVYGSTDIVLLGLLRSDTEVGLYQVAMRTAGILLVFLTASNWVLAPWFARLHAGGDRLRLQRLVTRTIRSVFALSLLVFIIFLFWGRDLLRFFFGVAFAPAYGALVILGGARLFNIAAGPVVNLLAMTGAQRALAWTVSGSALLNVAGCLLLIPAYGVLGAAASTAMAVVAYNLVLAVVVRRHLGIGASVLG